VDVMVVGSASFAQVVEALVPASKRLHREVNPVVMTENAFRAKLRIRDRFVSRIMREPRILIVGEGDELGKPAEDRAA